MEIHYHKENKTNGGKQIEFSAESNQFEKKIKSGNKIIIIIIKFIHYLNLQG